jgi:membrane complex biogenesis BtpA family protein
MKKKLLIGMVHLKPLPGTPLYDNNWQEVIKIAIDEANILQNEGFNAIIIENMHDVPYLNRNVGPEIISAFATIGTILKNQIKIPIGIQILAGANKEALAVAKTANLDFIRAEGFVFSHVADEGIMNSDAGELLRYRKMIDADNVKIYTDIKKKHSSHSITKDVSISEMVKAAEFFLSDGIIITGKSTGEPADVKELKQVKKTTDLPVFIGSGITEENLSEFWDYADGFIVGSYIKEFGYWKNSLSLKRIKKLVSKFNILSNKF